MIYNKPKHVTEARERQQERRFIERLKIAAIMIVIIVLYNFIDPENKFLAYLAVLLYKFSVLWDQFVLFVQRNWLVYLVGLMSAWGAAALLQNILAARSSLQTDQQQSKVGIAPDLNENWRARIPQKMLSMIASLRSFIAMVVVAYLIFISILLDPIGKFTNNVGVGLSQDLLFILNGICGLVVFLGLWLLFVLTESYFSKESRAHRERPRFFEEMQEALRDILHPMGFEEKEQPAGLAKAITFSRERLLVNFWYDYRDQLYFVDASSGSSMEEREKEIQEIAAKSKAGGELDPLEYAKLEIKDFSVEGSILDADGFKSNAISKLHRWLAENNISKRL